MGKFLASLLSIVFQLFLIAPIFASDDVRKVQEELRKRHLFYGNPTGEITPSLTAAVARYQGIKVFRGPASLTFKLAPRSVWSSRSRGSPAHRSSLRAAKVC